MKRTTNGTAQRINKAVKVIMEAQRRIDADTVLIEKAKKSVTVLVKELNGKKVKRKYRRRKPVLKKA